MNLCEECSKMDKTCCQLGSGVLLLTDKDIKRIGDYTGRKKFLDPRRTKRIFKQ